jgi:hypothetical protein
MSTRIDYQRAKEYDKAISDAAKDFRVTIIDLSKTPSYLEKHMHEDAVSYVDRSTNAWPEILLGIYKNKEFRCISFFHEIGHHLLARTWMKRVRFSKLPIEMECWQKGIVLANKYGIEFTDNAIAWGYRQALTYKNYR